MNTCSQLLNALLLWRERFSGRGRPAALLLKLSSPTPNRAVPTSTARLASGIRDRGSGIGDRTIMVEHQAGSFEIELTGKCAPCFGHEHLSYAVTIAPEVVSGIIRALQCKYRALKISAFSPTATASHAISVRQAVFCLQLPSDSTSRWTPLLFG